MTNILFLDIETLPIVANVWGLYEQNAVAVIENTRLCCYSAKWMGGEHITRATPDAKNEARLLGELWKLLDKADVVVAHNGDRFDIRKLNARFAKHKFLPPSPYKTVDTLKVAKRVFGFDSNKLNDLCVLLGLGTKLPTMGFALWQGCMAGDKKAWAQMKEYNAHDVVLLEKLYFRLLPWISNHPHTSSITFGCPKCGSARLQSRGYSRSATRSYKRFQCSDCGGWGRSTTAEKPMALTNA